VNKTETYIRERCVEEGDCLLWTGPTSETGHPSMMLQGTRRKCMARRVVYEMKKGPIPPGHLIVTTCGNRLCLHEDHLKAVTMPVARRMAAKRGDYKNPVTALKRTVTLRARSHITDAMVQTIRDADTAKAAHLATGVSLQHCYAIREGTRRAPLNSPFRALLPSTEAPRRAA
jgi:hypothetical protein